MITRLSALLHEDAHALLRATGRQLLETVGMDVVRAVVLDVLSGRNIRTSTEDLTRRRIASLNLALVAMFIEGSNQQPDFVGQLPNLAADILAEHNPKAETWLANWALGLTGKGVQNVLRDDRSLIASYRDTYIQTCADIVVQSQSRYGELEGTLTLADGRTMTVDWLTLLYLLNAVGAQTLTIRGSEKSLYGKFFEKLVLGTVLHMLGFRQVEADTIGDPQGVFWLASNRGRESDATILYAPGRGIRIDIGFIGRGNTEISLDKVSRYRREIEIGGQGWFMGTIIIVDRIGPRSRIPALAEEINGTIIQMSAGYWPRRLAQVLNSMLGFEHPLAAMDDDIIEDQMRAALTEIPLSDFIKM